jgi:hypothetical protein
MLSIESQVVTTGSHCRCVLAKNCSRSFVWWGGGAGGLTIRATLIVQGVFMVVCASWRWAGRWRRGATAAGPAGSGAVIMVVLLAGEGGGE